ncbi:single-stranded DNA-binding protein [Clostridium polynesiense]|uniref:single-stranded DNA-binding protein n=1 Tax=Clostridium polynesiense TaxID=1325933 RepID=UPI000590E22C|nr:single-stranded DNA-binding protein [Clostridium polynesiense]
MNKIVLVGRLIKDPELRILEGSEKVFARFVIAVDRNFRSADGEKKADLIPVTIWGRKAQVVCEYMKKGSLISISGRLRTGSYEDEDGKKRYIAEVVAEDFRFVSNKRPEKEELQTQ